MRMTAGMCLLAFLTMLVPARGDSNTGIITGNKVNLRARPDLKSAVLARLDRGDRVAVLDAAKGEWTRVKSGSLTGYVNHRYLAFTKAEKEEFALAEMYGRLYEIRAAGREMLVIDKKKNKVLIRTPLPSEPRPGPNIMYRYYPLVYVGIDNTEEAGTMFGGLYDLEKMEFLCDLSAIGMYFMSISPSKKYAAVDSGTSASARRLAIFDIAQKKVVLDTGYYPWPEEEGWTGKDEFVFFTTEVPKMPNLPPLTGEYNAYKEKLIWRNGSVARTRVISPAYVE